MASITEYKKILDASFEGKIMSTSRLSEISGSLNSYSSNLEEYIKNIEVVINSFNNQGIVQSFYSSGTFGEKQRERLEQILAALRKYRNAISDGDDSLVVQTRKYVERQENLLAGVEIGSTGLGIRSSLADIGTPPTKIKGGYISSADIGTPPPRLKEENISSVDVGKMKPWTPIEHKGELVLDTTVKPGTAGPDTTDAIGVIQEAVMKPGTPQVEFAEKISEINVKPGTPNPDVLQKYEEIVNVKPGTPNPELFHKSEMVNVKPGVPNPGPFQKIGEITNVKPGTPGPTNIGSLKTEMKTYADGQSIVNYTELKK